MFNIKQYQKDNSTLIKSLEISKLTLVSTHPSEINGGFGKMKVKFVLSIANMEFEIWNFIRVQFEQNVLIRWSIINVRKRYWKTEETLELEILWIASNTATVLTNNVYNDTASNIMKDLVDNYNTDYWFNILSYDTSSIPDTVWNIALDFSSYKSYKQAMEEVANTAGLFFFIDNDWKVYLQERDWFQTHTLKAAKDVDSVTIDEDSRELVNTLILKHGAGTTTYSDATSISTYWKREKYLDKSSELTNQATADSFWNNYIAKFKDKTKKISIIVNKEYNFFSIKPWHLINVRNLLYDIDELQVTKITYWLETCSIQLETFYSFSKEIFTS